MDSKIRNIIDIAVIISGLIIAGALFYPVAQSIDIDKITNEEILSLLAVVLAFAGLISYLLYKIISRDIEAEIKILIENERKASRAEVCTVLSYILGEFYYKDKENSVSFLKKALEFNEEAFEEIRNLPKEKFGKVIYRVKNNFACVLADLQCEKNKERKGIDFRNKERAIQLKNELWELIKSGEISKYSPMPYENEETCAWVIWNFAENEEEEKQKALQIIKNLKERCHPERYLEIEKKYGL